jgi:hypothetical protein
MMKREKYAAKFSLKSDYKRLNKQLILKLIIICADLN